MGEMAGRPYVGAPAAHAPPGSGQAEEKAELGAPSSARPRKTLPAE